MTNRAASRIVLEPFSEELVARVARDALEEVGGKVTCGFVFVSSDYRPHLSDFLELAQLHGHVPILGGSSGVGLVGTALEAEGATGFSLLLLNLPETKVVPVRLPVLAEEESFDEAGIRALVGPEGKNCCAWIVVANPFQLAVEPWLAAWNAAWPGIPTLGGLGSGGRTGDDCFVFLDREMVDGGVAFGFKGGLRVETLVSQGCRPVGEPLTITGAEGHLVTALGSRPAFQVLDETFGALPDEEKKIASGNLFVGLAMSEYVDEFKTGDFLVRNLLGGDQQSGVLAIGAQPRVGQTLQFQLRNARSADAELRQIATAARSAGGRPFASLVFACAGRGRNLFGEPHHDARVLKETLGQHASAGFFCNGEIGPVGGKSFVHGYTASVALLCDE
ncbi:MAG: FIST C-terminal domain-containing protein [Chthoniobacteraceae bacterium]